MKSKYGSIVWITFLVLTGTSALQAADGLPSGKFEGQGTWKMADGSTGVYDVVTTIGGISIRSDYVWRMEGGDREQTMSFSLVPGSDGMLQVVGDDQQVMGRGFCLGQECSYRAEMDGTTVQENVRFVRGELVKFGVKFGPGFSVVWREVLTER